MLIVDTSVLFAAINSRETHHQACAELLRAETRLVLPAPVVTETCMMLERRIGPEHEARFLDVICRGAFEITDLDATGYKRAAELVAEYADLALGFVDSAVIAVAERLRATRLATLNRRDFTVVRPAHAENLTLVP